MYFRGGSRIPRRRGRQPLHGGAPTYDLPNFAKNCMKLRIFLGRGGRPQIRHPYLVFKRRFLLLSTQVGFPLFHCSSSPHLASSAPSSQYPSLHEKRIVEPQANGPLSSTLPFSIEPGSVQCSPKIFKEQITTFCLKLYSDAYSVECI